MKFKIVADSASDMLALDGVPFTSVPLKINTSEKEYVDVSAMHSCWHQASPAEACGEARPSSGN